MWPDMPPPPPSCIALIGCGKQKLDRRADASELYTSTLFRLSVRYATRFCHGFYILSAKHGLLAPHDKVDPYDVSLADFSEDEQRAWDNRVAEQIRAKTSPTDVLILLAGVDYTGVTCQLPNFVQQPFYRQPLFTRLQRLSAAVRSEQSLRPTGAGWWCQDCDEYDDFDEPLAMQSVAAEHVRLTGHYVHVHIKPQGMEAR